MAGLEFGIGDVAPVGGVNLEMVEALGKAYGFRPVFVWQPDIFSKPKLVPFEAEEKAKYGWTSSLFVEVHRQLERADALVANPGFLNLSGIFSETDSLQFLDYCHTTEEANARIASVLVSKLIEIAKVGPGAPASKRGVVKLGDWMVSVTGAMVPMQHIRASNGIGFLDADGGRRRTHQPRPGQCRPCGMRGQARP